MVLEKLSPYVNCYRSTDLSQLSVCRSNHASVWRYMHRNIHRLRDYIYACKCLHACIQQGGLSSTKKLRKYNVANAGVYWPL